MLRRAARMAMTVVMVALVTPGIGQTPALGASNADDVGLVDPATGMWYLRDQDGSVTEFYFGNPGDYPIAGDWDCDGIDTPGMYRQSDGYVYLRNSNAQGIADIRFFFGNPGDVPLAGDFDGDGCDTVSIYRPAEGRIFIINALGENDGGLGAAEFDYYFGNPGDKPFVGDFDGDGMETIGLHRESTGLVYFNNQHVSKFADHEFIYGDPADRIVAGDWNGDGADSPALFRPGTTSFYFRYTNTQGFADDEFVWGESHFVPVAGRFFDPGDPGIEPDPPDPPPADGDLTDPGLDAWGLVGVSWSEDSDEDLLSDGLEQWLVDTFKPYYVFDEEETACLDPLNDVAVFTQVTPWLRWNWPITNKDSYQRGAVMTFVASYPVDCGVWSLDSWLPALISHNHAGDTEAVWIYVLEDWSGVWSIEGISIKRHDDDPEWYEAYAFEYHPGTSHPRIYVSESKHAQYVSGHECENYWKVIPFEDCGGGVYVDLPTPFTHNVGEYHHTLADDLDPLFPGESAWADEDFCGGLVWYVACAGSLLSKWSFAQTPDLNGWYLAASVNRWYKIEWTSDHWEMWDSDQGAWLQLWTYGYDVGVEGTGIVGAVTGMNHATEVATTIDWNNGLHFEHD